MIDNSKVQLIQKGHGTDAVFRDLEPPLFLHPCPPAVILVSSVGQDADHITAMELLSAVKSAGNLAASIFLKPFCFEGQRRQVEAADLIGKLETCSNFHIVVPYAPESRFLDRKFVGPGAHMSHQRLR